MSNKVKYFNIHNLIRLRIESDSPAIFRQCMHQLAEFEEESERGGSYDIIIQDYDRIPNLDNFSSIADYYFYYKNNLNIPALKTCFNFIDKPLSVYCDRLIFPVSLIVHLALLSKGYSLIHAAGVEYKGRNYLFPAFGGVGKTALTAAVVYSGGKLYGDDMNIIGRNEILGYPQDFSVYPYHLQILRYKDKEAQRAFSKTNFYNHLTNVLRHINISPFRVIKRALDSRKIPCVSVPPRRIFGNECFAKRGTIDRIYYIKRTQDLLNRLQIGSIKADELAQICTNILFHELYEYIRPLYAYSALFPFSLEDIFYNTKKILEDMFSAFSCRIMEIPSSMTDEVFQNEILNILDKEATS